MGETFRIFWIFYWPYTRYWAICVFLILLSLLYKHMLLIVLHYILQYPKYNKLLINSPGWTLFTFEPTPIKCIDMFVRFYFSGKMTLCLQHSDIRIIIMGLCELSKPYRVISMTATWYRNSTTNTRHVIFDIPTYICGIKKYK